METSIAPGRVHQVLLIDNADDDARRSVAAMQAVPEWHLSIMRVRRFSEAIRILITTRFDVIVLEWVTADAEGIPALAAVRGAAPGTPVVVYSRQVDAEAVIRAIRAGAVECVAKAHLAPEALGPLVIASMERHRFIRQLHQACHEAAHRATHDPLTGIANRALFLDQLDRALALGTRNQQKTGVLFIDLDGFKAINDARGHAIGDALLREVARRLQGCGRRSDTVARLGGDEFVMLLPDVTSRRDISLVKEQVLALMQAPVMFDDGTALPLGASIGAAMSPLDGVDATVLMEAADAEMYREKQLRRRRDAHPIDKAERPTAAPRIGNSMTRRREARLRYAVDHGEMQVYFQPVFDVAADRLVAVEALLRWVSPDGTVWLPDQFLSLAEDTGLIVPIGDQVLRQACDALMGWRNHGGIPDLRVAINLSVVQLREHGFIGAAVRTFQAAGCPATAVTFELTERQAVDDHSALFGTLQDLARTGAALCIDAFGVDHASLTVLRDAPINALKIDHRFVASVPVEGRDQAIVGSLVRLCRELGLTVSAAGVEQRSQSRHLTRLGCTVQQGWHFGRPLPMGEMDRVLQARSARSKEPRGAAPSRRKLTSRRRIRRDGDVEPRPAAPRVPPP